ncbi:MAG TPA: LysE family translocator [Blastocatellia bacterium]|nr:LysE family translocator [Blastocatellia bacterium]
MIDTQILAFTGVAAILTITPGPDTMLVMRNVLTRGQRAGLLTMLGISSGLFIHATLSGLGLSWILVRSVTAFEIVKMLGACYLIVLGYQSLRQALRQADRAHQDPSSNQIEGAVAPAHWSWRRAFMEGMLNNVLNPKVAVFYLAFLPQFINPQDSVLFKSVLLAAIHFILGIAWLSIVVLLLGKIRATLERPRIKQALETLTGLALIGFGVRLATERR